MNNYNIADFDNAIAIVGMVGRFPKAKDVEMFWKNLRDGIEGISFFDEQEIDDPNMDPTLLHHPHYVNAKGALDNIDLFDASFFDYTPREAEIIDPQQRIFLECAWEALEVAGYTPETYPGTVGVYAGVTTSDYFLYNLWSNREKLDALGGTQVLISNDKDYLATRISYKLNLKGPSININTACSTSLVAVHLACQGLLNYECDMALAGGISVGPVQKVGYFYQEGGLHSPDGHCRAFDAKAQGTVGGNGVGIVVMKRLQDALVANDTIHAVIRGSAINNDGSQKVGFTAPSIDGQARVIAEAHALAAINAETITYVEAHGTGTFLGDPIEIAALTRAFRIGTQKKRYCAIGSVKTNIGHLDAAAGVVGLMKTVLALKHKMLPPSLHFEEPNPNIDFENSPFYVNNRLADWHIDTGLRRAGVSAFGIGGTNAHVVLEEAPALESRHEPDKPLHLLVLSTRSEQSLEQSTKNLHTFLVEHPDVSLADVAYTYQVGRKDFSHRRMLVCRDIPDAVKALKDADPKRIFTIIQDVKDRPVVFMFPGGGTQYINMGLELYQTERLFKEQVDLCAELLRSHITGGIDLRTILYADTLSDIQTEQQLKQASIALPAIFTIEYALAKLWISWGVSPSMMIGHSLGEYVAATLAGVISLEDALALVALRGQLFQQLPPGAMLSVQLSEEQVYPYLGDGLFLAAVNAPTLCTVSGSVDAIEALELLLNRQGVTSSRIHIDVAAHSQMILPILERFQTLAGQLHMTPPHIPYISNVTGSWMTAEDVSTPDYWSRHLRQTVRFRDGIEKLLESNAFFLEVGPGKTLSTLVRQNTGYSSDIPVCNSLRHPHDSDSDYSILLHALGRLWLTGCHMDWFAFHAGQKRHRIPLPTYPFERQSYWVQPQHVYSTQTPRSSTGSIFKEPDIANWFYIPSWKSTLPVFSAHSTAPVNRGSCWLIFDEGNLGSAIKERLVQAGEDVITVVVGESYRRLDENVYSLPLQSTMDYHTLLVELRTRGKFPQTFLHLWSISTQQTVISGPEYFTDVQHTGYSSLLSLAQALIALELQEEVYLIIVSNFLFSVNSNEVVLPEKMPLLAPCKILPQENPSISCLCIDIPFCSPDDAQRAMLVEQLIGEAELRSADLIVAYRGHQRLVQTYEQVQLEKGAREIRQLRHRGVYLITGGLGKIGLLLASYLARTYQARIILLGRTVFPERTAWPQWLETHDDLDITSSIIRELLVLEQSGAEFLTLHADVAQEDDMRKTMDIIREHFGLLHGIFHTAGITKGKSIGSLIKEVKFEEAEEQFQPKAYGLYFLERFFEQWPLDFCILFSSNASVLGGLGLVSYAAANLFMDAFAVSRNKNSVSPWISINWDAWLARHQSERARQQMLTSIDAFSMTADEGIDALFRVLQQALVSQMVVSTGNLHARRQQWLQRESPNHQKESTKFYPRPDLQSPYRTPRNEVEHMVANIWKELLGLEKVGIYDNYFELGGHSLLATQLISRLRDTFRINLSLRDIIGYPFVADIAQIIMSMRSAAQQATSPTTSALVGIQTIGAKSPFFCVHPQGGSVLCYYDLAQQLGRDQPFFALQDPSLEGDLEPFTNMETMAAYYIDAIRTVQSRGPYHLGGWSFGGIVAFEMAHQLLRQGQHIASLSVLDSPAPGHMDPITIDDSELVALLVLRAGYATRKTLPLAHEDLRQLSPHEQLTYLLQHLSYEEIQSAGLGEQLNFFMSHIELSGEAPPSEDVRRLYLYRYLRAVKAHAQAIQSYRPQIYPYRINVFRAREAGPEHLTLRNHPAFNQPSFGWDMLSKEPVQTFVVPGDHNTMVAKPHVQSLTQELRNILDQAETRTERE